MFEKLFSGFRDSALKTVSFVTIIICVVLLILDILYFSMKEKKNKKKSAICVIISTLIGCLLMIPMTTSFDKLVQIRSLKLSENKDYSVENQKLRTEIQKLNDKINILEYSQISAMQFERIAELALLKAELLQTKVYYENKGDRRKVNLPLPDKFTSFYQDKMLLVCNHEIEAKFGVDIKNIKIKKINENTISVSGIIPMFIGATKNNIAMPISEIREIETDGSDHIKSTKIKNDNVSKQDIAKFAEEKNKVYQESLKEMGNFEFLKEPIINLAQNFIKMIFAPTYGDDNIKFDENSKEDALPIEEFIKQEMKDIESKKENLEKKLSTTIS